MVRREVGGECRDRANVGWWAKKMVEFAATWQDIL